MTAGAALATGLPAAREYHDHPRVGRRRRPPRRPQDERPARGPPASSTASASRPTQSVETATGFHIHGTIAGTGRIDWSDGTYTLIDSVDRFAFNAVGKGTTTFSETHVDSGDFYSADGVFEFRQTFHEVEHFTETNGVVQVDVARGHFHFFGDC